MLKPVEMQKVRIIAIKKVAGELIKLLHELGVMEINVCKYERLDSGRPLEFYNEVSEQLVRMRAIRNSLSNYAQIKLENKSSLEGKKLVEEAKKIKLDEVLKTKQDEMLQLENEMKKMKDNISLLGKLRGFGDIDFSKLNTKTITYVLGELPGEKLDQCKLRLYKSLKHYNLIYIPRKDAKSIALVLYNRSENNPEAILAECGFVKIDVPESVAKPLQTLNSLESRMKETENRAESIKKELSSLAHKHYPDVAALEKSLSIEADRAEIASKFNATSSTYIIDGWIKASDYQKLNDSLARFDDDALLEKVSFNHHEVPPTVLANPKYASPLEFITQSYSLPNYYELDPTMIYFITLPILYGMIVGDVGYGILSLIISSWLMGKFKNSYIMSNVSRLWFYGAFPSILFGIIFDEWMGAGHLHWIEVLAGWGLNLGIHAPLYTGFSRVHQLTLLIGVTALMGIIHLALGFILGAINEWGHSKKHAIAKLCWLGVEIGGVVAVIAFMLNALPAGYGNIGAGLFAISMIGLVATEGIIGILEVPGLTGNILSYARIAAIGVVGVILAEIINEFLTPLPQQGILALLFFPLFIILHSVNAFIAMFESLIQGGRLNIIEFKSKFMKGGGKLFEPFALHS